MAGITPNPDVSIEIEQLKAVTRCKVMKNVGDFMYLIDVSIPNTSALIKFQLPAKYPEQAPVIFIKHQSMSKDDIRKMMMSLPEDVMQIVKLFHLIKSYISENHPSSTTGEDKQSSPPCLREKKKEKQLAEDGAESTKKPSMRTAADVIKRMQWDSSLDKEACIVGYIDRFMGIQEQPFNSFNWVNPAEADWMDLNIPEHRIEYFKYKDVVVWEKKSRIDNVFGSTGGQTIDQLFSTGDLSDTKLEDGDSLKAVEQSPPAATNDTATSKRATQKASKHVEKHDSKRPNHFIAIPVTEERVVKAVDEIQDQYLTLSDSDGAENRKELYNLHVTLCALRIDNQNDLDTVTEVLYNLIMESTFHEKFTLTTLGTFWSRVLYAGAKLDDEFVKFVLKLRETLVEKGIRIFDDVQEFIPHVTIFSFPRCKSESLHLPLASFLAIRADANNHVLDLSAPLEQVVLYSMERSDTNRYLEQIVLDLHV